MTNMEVVEFNGTRFGRYPDSPHPAARLYFAPGQVDRACGIESLHREVWKFHNGPIPPGHHVHHKDGDTLNNKISNLDCVPAGQHLRDHVRTPEARQRAREHVGRIRHLSTDWHSTPEGKAHHSKLGEAQWANRQKQQHVCEHCGAEFKTYVTHSRFCQPKCKAAWRRANGVDDEARTCVICGTEFTVNRFKPNKTCSKPCGMALKTSNRVAKLRSGG